jgi:N-glycosylase/DNA lyase
MSGRGFEKGVSGNPGGLSREIRRAHRLVKEVFAAVLAEPDDDEPKLSRLESAARRLMKMIAKEPDLRAAVAGLRFVVETVAGKPTQPIEMPSPVDLVLERLTDAEMDAFDATGALPEWAERELGIEHPAEPKQLGTGDAPVN